MKIRLLKFLKSLFLNKEDLFKESIPPETDNPYIAARYEWSFMFSDILIAKYNWQRIGFILGIINITLVTGLVLVSLQSRFIPYVVKVDNLGNASFAGLLIKQEEISPSEINSFLRRYIIETRSVISDPVAQKHRLDFVYRVSLGEAKIILDSFYKNQNPFDVVKNETIDVKINLVLPVSKNTWQVRWTEIHRDSFGHVGLQNSFEGLINVGHKTPSKMDDINDNPLGIYLTHLSWASQQ